MCVAHDAVQGVVVDAGPHREPVVELAHVDPRHAREQSEVLDLQLPGELAVVDVPGPRRGGGSELVPPGQPVGEGAGCSVGERRVAHVARRDEPLADPEVGIAMLRGMARAVRRPRERRPARGLRCECEWIGAASQQQVDGTASSLPRRMVERRSGELAPCVDRRSDVEQQRRRLDAPLARCDHECPRQIRLGRRHDLGVARTAHGRLAVAAQAGADQHVRRPRLPRRTELGQHLGDVRPAACDREGVGPAARASVAPPEVRAALGEHPHEPGGAVAIDGPWHGPVELVPTRPRGRAVLEKQRDQLAVLAVEGMRQRVRSRDGRSRLEQQPNAGEIARLGRVVQRLAVVGIGAPGEQEAVRCGSWAMPAAP